MNPKASKPNAITFHGFLGSGNDFKYLDKYFDLYPMDLKPSSKLETWKTLAERLSREFEENLNRILLKNKNPEVYIFSYSMGSKAMFSIFEKISDLFNAKNLKCDLVFISTHFGIYGEALDSQEQAVATEIQTEKDLRSKMNTQFLEILSSKDLDEFLARWSELKLFAEDVRQTTSWSHQEIEHYFNHWNQSQLHNRTDQLLDSNFIRSLNVVFGSLDSKYKNQALRIKEISNLRSSDKISLVEIQNRGHRIISKSDFEYIFKHLGVKKL